MSINSPIRSQRVLLTGGRAPATLELARQLASSGHRIYMAESCPVDLTKHSRAIVRSYTVPKPNESVDAYIRALNQIIKIEQIDWLIPTCEEIFIIAQRREQLRGDCHIFVDTFDKLNILHNKWSFIQRAKAMGFQVPTTHLITSINEAEAVVSLSGKWVLKPVYSRFASNIFIVEKGKFNHKPHPSCKMKYRHTIKQKARSFAHDFKRHMKGLSVKHPWLAQSFIEGTAYCSYSIVKQGKLTAHVVYPVTFTAGIGACISFEPVHHPTINRWVEKFVFLENFTGQIAFDFIVCEDGQVYPIECNPRLTSGIHLFRDNDRIDHAIFPKTPPLKTIVPHPNRKAMIALAMATYGLCSIRSWTTFKQWLQFMIRGKDVVFQIKDLRPFLQQFKLLWWNYKISRSQHISIKEASTYDIEWNGSGTV